MNEETPAQQRGLSHIQPTDPFANLATVKAEENPGLPPGCRETNMAGLFSILADGSYQYVAEQAAAFMEAEGLTDRKPCISFSESIAETRSALTNCCAFVGRQDFEKSADALAMAVFSMFCLGKILNEESGGRFSELLAERFQTTITDGHE